MKKFTLHVTAEVGLHARPAAMFVQQANQFDADIQVRNITADSEWADAKSILSVLTLGVEKDHEIELEVDGLDEDEAAEALTGLVRSNFGENH
jgi:phosphotransferase system HPr (HPr) family protein